MTDRNHPLFAVILAGGSGTRFWPASRRLTPKQLLPLAPGAASSLLRGTVARLEPLVARDHVLISTGEHLLDAMKKELPELADDAFLAEPEAKNTAPCIAWAASVAKARDPEAILCVLPSDQHASHPAAFRHTLSQAVQCARDGAIVTIGIVPSHPETGYGYVKKGAARGAGYMVEGFFEKPDLAAAESYLRDGRFLWNAGIFVFRAADMLAAIERHLPTIAQALEQLRRSQGEDPVPPRAAVAAYFSACPKISIDYGVMEKESQLMVVPGEFGWSDLGSWQSAWDLSTKDEHGNVGSEGTVFVAAERNLVKNFCSHASKKVVALVGVEDLCVIETDDALLVLPRGRSQDVREVVEQLKATGRGELT